MWICYILPVKLRVDYKVAMVTVNSIGAYDCDCICIIDKE